MVTESGWVCPYCRRDCVTEAQHDDELVARLVGLVERVRELQAERDQLQQQLDGA